MNEPKFDWAKPLTTTILTLKITGVLPINASTRFYRNLSKLYSAAILFFFVTLSTFLQTTQTIFFTRDTKKLAAAAFQLLQEYQAAVKIYVVFTKSDVLENIIHFLNSEKSFQPQTQTQKSRAVAGLRFWKKSALLLYSGSYVCSFFWTVYPILDNLTEQSELLFDSWFPFNVTVYPSYQIAYVYQCFDLWLCALSVVNIDTVIFALMIFVVLQCDILCENLKNVGCNKGDFGGDFRRCVRHHKKILRWVSKFKLYFNYFGLGFQKSASIFSTLWFSSKSRRLRSV